MIEFAKYTGSGNDFILIDNRKQIFPIQPTRISQLCDRKHGIGADGLILLESSDKADYKMRIFNADGSEAEMCGNGIRCLTKWILSFQPTPSHLTIETKERLLSVSEQSDQIQVYMGDPVDLSWNIPINLFNQTIIVHFLNTGVPHVVYFVDNLEAVDIQKWGSHIRFHPAFQPKGANVNFAKLYQDELWIRTYERGVEGETLACGTGATACALAASALFGIKSPVSVYPLSKERLVVSFHNFTQVSLSGPAKQCFQGQFCI